MEDFVGAEFYCVLIAASSFGLRIRHYRLLLSDDIYAVSVQTYVHYGKLN